MHVCMVFNVTVVEWGSEYAMVLGFCYIIGSRREDRGFARAYIGFYMVVPHVWNRVVGRHYSVIPPPVITIFML